MERNIYKTMNAEMMNEKVIKSINHYIFISIIFKSIKIYNLQNKPMNKKYPIYVISLKVRHQICFIVLYVKESS